MMEQKLINERMAKLGDLIGGKKLGRKDTTRYIWSACMNCGKERWVKLFKGKPRNIRCHSCVSKDRQQGSNNSKWKGGRVKDSKGYILIWANPTNTYYKMHAHSYILEHRLVMAQHLGRCLKSWEIVHHINHIRDDNRIENLKLHTMSDHQAITILEMENKKLEARIKKLEMEIDGNK